jgi:hypothetical protein
MAPVSKAEFDKIKNNNIKGSSSTDYIKVINHSGNAFIVPYFIPKGYAEGQNVYDMHQTATPTSQITSKLSWAHIVYLGHAQFSKGTTTQAMEGLKEQSELAKAFAPMIQGLVDFVKRTTGLFQTHELIFSQGTGKPTGMVSSICRGSTPSTASTSSQWV